MAMPEAIPVAALGLLLARDAGLEITAKNILRMIGDRQGHEDVNGAGSWRQGRDLYRIRKGKGARLWLSRRRRGAVHPRESRREDYSHHAKNTCREASPPLGEPARDSPPHESRHAGSPRAGRHTSTTPCLLSLYRCKST